MNFQHNNKEELLNRRMNELSELHGKDGKISEVTVL
jgi:hypothetical protein